MWIVFLVFPFSLFFTISPCNQNKTEQANRESTLLIIKARGSSTMMKQKPRKQNTHTRTRSRAGGFILDKKQTKKKKIETILL